jgi:tRNA (guanine37-N1)-methyltransferase
MKHAKVAEADAEDAKRLLSRLGVSDRSRMVKHSRSYVYFPVLDIDAKAKKLICRAGIRIVEAPGAKAVGRMDYKERLGRILGRNETKQMARGYELLGNIAIIEISEGLKEKEKAIAQALMDSNPGIKTVLAKAGAVSGIYRVRRLRYISGARNYVAAYSENNCRFVFDVRKVFFSGKLSYERSRIAKLVRDGERVMVVGAGVGPFAIEIAKSHPKAKVTGIEINRHAYDYMIGNIRLNKAQNVKAALGDARKICSRYANSSDRIIIPMPTTSLEFLDAIMAMAKRRAVVHIYAFGGTDSVLDDSWKKIMAHAKENRYSARLLGHRIVRPYSAKEVELAIDFMIDKAGRRKKR